MTKYLLIALAVLGALLAGSGVLLKRSYSQQGVLKAELQGVRIELQGVQAASKLAAQVSVARSKLRASTGLKSQVASQNLYKATRAHQEWASSPVPLSVQEALQGAISERHPNVPTEPNTPPPGLPDGLVGPDVPGRVRTPDGAPGE